MAGSTPCVLHSKHMLWSLTHTLSLLSTTARTPSPNLLQPSPSLQHVYIYDSLWFQLL